MFHLPDRPRSLERLLEEGYPLCREDLIWAFTAMKQKAAEGNSHLLELPQPRLVRNYLALADLALLLLIPASGSGLEEAAWRALLREASHGLQSENHG